MSIEGSVHEMVQHPSSYWSWFLRGKHPGWRRLVDWWLVLHAGIGVAAVWLVPVRLEVAAQAVLLPLAGVFVGMSFAWVGSALAIAQSPEIDKLSEKNPAGFEVYVYTFQTAILALLVCLVLWGIAGLGVFDTTSSWDSSGRSYYVAAWVLYGTASLAIRECWHVVLGAQLLLLYQRAVRRIDEKKG